MIPNEVLIAVSMFLTIASGLSALIIFVPDVVKTLSGAPRHKWSRAPLPLALGTILFFSLTIVGVLTG